MREVQVMYRTGFWLTMLVVIVLLTTLSARADNARTVQLRTTEMPPYQMLEQGQLGGISVSTLSCAFAALDTPYTIQVVPAKRAEHDVKTAVADGFTLAVLSTLKRINLHDCRHR